MMLRDHLVCQVNHQTIQKRLLAEKNLTFEEALEVALALEAVDTTAKLSTYYSNVPDTQ